MSEAIRSQLKRDIQTAEVSIASLGDTIEKAEFQLADMKSRQKAAIAELKKLNSALRGLEGRKRTPVVEEVEVSLDDVDPAALAEIEARNEREQKNRTKGAVS